MWWWNEEVKDIIARKKAAFKELCRFPSEENKIQYKRLRNQTRKTVARAMRMEANQDLKNLYRNSNSVFYLLRRMKNKAKDLKRGRCLRKRRTIGLYCRRWGKNLEGTHGKDHE